jgi:hypothetical protein
LVGKDTTTGESSGFNGLKQESDYQFLTGFLKKPVPARQERLMNLP